jgi:hypothetical protein
VPIQIPHDVHFVGVRELLEKKDFEFLHIPWVCEMSLEGDDWIPIMTLQVTTGEDLPTFQRF